MGLTTKLPRILTSSSPEGHPSETRVRDTNCSITRYGMLLIASFQSFTRNTFGSSQIADSIFAD